MVNWVDSEARGGRVELQGSKGEDWRIGGDIKATQPWGMLTFTAGMYMYWSILIKESRYVSFSRMSGLRIFLGKGTEPTEVGRLNKIRSYAYY